MKKIIAFFCVLLLVAITGLYLRAGNESYTFKIQTEIENVKLSVLWKAVINDINVQNLTANLQWLHLKVSDGKIQSLHFEFAGKNSQGESRIYYVDINSIGLVKIYSKPIRDFQHMIHPAHIFNELDEFGLKNIGSDYTLDISFEWGDLGFNSSYGDLYLLKDGELIPLEKITFHVNTPICRILVCRDSCDVWFIQDDLSKAKEVVFR
jgi:hypothetical protein